MMPKDRGQSLAERLRTAIEARQAERARVQKEATERQQWIQQQRVRLLEDLREFGQTVGHLAVSGSAMRVVFRFDGRELRFETRGAKEVVRVSGTDLRKGTEAVLHEELNRWVLTVPTDTGRDEQLVLFDRGLERLVATALGVSPREQQGE